MRGGGDSNNIYFYTVTIDKGVRDHMHIGTYDEAPDRIMFYSSFEM